MLGLQKTDFTNDNDSHVDPETRNRDLLEINFHPQRQNYKQYNQISFEQWQFFCYFKYIYAMKTNWRVLLLWAEILGLSLYAFMIIRMKYDSAIFSLLLSLMDVILIQLLVQHMSEISHTCLKQLFRQANLALLAIF